MKHKTIKTILTSVITFSAFAAQANTDDFLMKFRGGFMHTSENVKTGSASTASTHKFNDGYVGEIAFDYFFSKDVGIELSAGYGSTKFKNNSSVEENLRYVPVTATLIFKHSYKHLSPYIGLGYAHQFISNEPGTTKIKSGGGAVAQIGMDYMTSDEFGWNIDLKHRLKLDHKITEGTETFKNDMSTTALTVGVTFKF